MKSAFVKSVAAAIAGGVFAFAATAGDAPSLGEVSVTEVGDSYVTFSAAVSDFGDGATGATASFAYGITADALDRTQQVATVTSVGDLSLTLTRLQPNTVYHAALVVRNSGGASATSETIAMHTTETQDSVPESQIGLNQTFFTSANANWTKDYTTLKAGTDWTHYTDDDRIYRRELGTIMAYVGGNGKSGEYTSEVWGDAVYWPMNGGQWAYWGYIYMEKGKSFQFRAYIDDAERVAVTNIATGAEVVLINDSSWGSRDTSSVFVPSVTGWYPLEVRMSDGSGGLGGRDTSNNYKNTVNMGYSSDGGATWNLLLDPGDGSLLRTGGGAVDDIDVSESASGGSLSLALSFAESESARTLAAVWGPVHGGSESTNGWASAAVALEVAAGETSATLAPPDGWGSDDCLVLRYCFVDADGGVLGWSPSTYWRDLSEPSVSDLALDGSGGDTLKVTGYATAPGGACSLQVYVGTSADAMSPWPGASREMSASGRFSFTLFADDASSGLMLKPGETYCVAVSAKAPGGAATVGEAVLEKMAGAATFASASASYSRRNATFKGAMADLGMTSATSVSLWIGESDDEDAMEQAGDAVAVTKAGEEFSISYAVPEYEKAYRWQLRAANVAQGGTATAEARTAVATLTIPDSTTYTWKGGSGGAWTDAANWSDNKNGDCAGYPKSTSAAAVFPAETAATVTLGGEAAVGDLNLSASGAGLTLVGDGAATTRLRVGGYTYLNGRSGSLTLKGVRMTCVYDVRVGGASTVELDDATLECGSSLTFYTGSPKVRFVGSTPLLRMTGTWSRIAPASSSAASDVLFEFVVPAGGYATAPVQGASSAARSMGLMDASPYDGTVITLDVADGSPAKRADATLTTTLVSWPNTGVYTNSVVKAGSLPSDPVAPSGGDYFEWSDPTSAKLPKQLSVTLVGASGEDSLAVTGEPVSVAAGGLSPASDTCTKVERGGSVTCTAPDGLVQVSDTMRATCTGYRLYSVDAETRERTLVGSGTGTSATYTNEDGTPHSLAWQWKVEYKVEASAGANGAASVNGEGASAWVERGTLATVTQTANDGYFLGKWTGDVPAEHDKDQSLRFVVRDRGYSFAASFLPVVYVSPSGSDSNDGSSWEKAMATIPAALAKDADGTGVCVLLADGVYESSSQIKISTGSTVAGAGEGAKAVLKLTKKLTGNANDTGMNDSFVVLAHEDARLYNVAVTTGAASGSDPFGRCVWIEKSGFVDHCVVTNGATVAVAYSTASLYRNNPVGFGGGGVALNGGGIVRGCDVSRNAVVGLSWSCGMGGNVAMSGGLVDGCRIARANEDMGFTGGMAMAGLAMNGGTVRSSLVALSDWTDTTEPGGTCPTPTGVFMVGGVLENCTVAENSKTNSSKAVGVYLLGAATVRNCIVRGNRNGVKTLGGVGNWSSDSWNWTSWTGDMLYTCTAPTPSGASWVGNVDVEPQFADAAGGDFTLPPSALSDAGAWREWMDWAADLAGNPRVGGSAPDLGCYEIPDDAVSVGFDVGWTDSMDAVSFRAVVAGADAGELTYRWTLTPEAGGEAVSFTASGATELKADVAPGRYTVRVEALLNGVVVASHEGEGVYVHPKDVYVSLDGPGTFPYDTPAKATDDLAAAVDAAGDGSTVHVGEGLFSTAESLIVNKRVAVAGEGPDRTFFQCMKGDDAMLLLRNEGAVVSGLAVTGWDYAKNQRASLRGGLILYSGTVTNCWIMHQLSVNNSLAGVGARIAGAGAVVDCVFTNNRTQCSGGWGASGGAVYMYAEGLIDRCRFLDNEVGDGGTSYGGGVYLKAGTLRNSFFCGNWSVNYAGAIAAFNAGKVYNCTVVGNTAKDNYGGVYVDGSVSSGGGAVLNCLAYRNYHGTAVEDEADPGFADAAGGDYRLSASSAAIDASEDADLGDFDLDLGPRVQGARADLGCHEFDLSQPSVGVAYAKSKALGPCDVTFTATALNAVLEGSRCYWTFDGRKPTADDHDAAGVSVTRAFGVGTVTARFATEIGGKTYDIDRPDWFTVFGEAVHVVAENGGAAYPYATWETAATNVADAMTAVQSGSTLLFGDGAFRVDSRYEFKHPFTMTSLNGAERTLLVPTWNSILSFEDAGAELSGVTVSNAFWNNSAGHAITLRNGATARGCAFVSSGTGGGAVLGVYDGASAVDCRLRDCTANGSLGSAVYVSGAASLVDRCVVEGSRSTRASAAVYVASGTLRNTVVADSALVDSAAVVAAGGSSRVENCTIVGNADRGTSAVVAGLRVASAGAAVVNTIAYGNTSLGKAADVGGVSGYEACLVTSLTDGTDPRFRDSAERPFVPQSSSPCANAGTTLPWMTGGSLDVYGRPRLIGNKPDIGAAECQSKGLQLLVR